ncbi:hypothetical protein JCM33374_g3209 [Metschnikowia sp. JCM 33374]|nr:hypothetical protein JCM33374_g3209 [Metschnikowia sp. JCM 33374]
MRAPFLVAAANFGTHFAMAMAWTNFKVSFPDVTSPQQTPVHNETLTVILAHNEVFSGKKVDNHTQEDFHMEVSQTAILEITEMLDLVIARMQSFIHDQYFDSKAFETHATQLKLRLLDLGSNAENMGYFTDISGRLGFAKHTYSAMVEAARSLRQYIFGGSIEHHLLSSIIQLNVSLLALHDSQGVPDPTVGGFRSKVEYFTYITNHWAEIFKHVGNTDPVLQQRFQNKYTAVKNTLQFMSTYIGSSEEDGEQENEEGEGKEKDEMEDEHMEEDLSSC